MALREAGSLEAAIDAARAALAAADGAGERRRLAAFLLVGGRVDEAATELERSIELARGTGGNAAELAESRYALGRVCARRGDIDAALEHLDAASRSERELGARGLLAQCWLEIGTLHAEQGRWSRAARALERAVDAASAPSAAAERIAALERLTRVHLRAEHWQDAEAAAERALAGIEACGDDALAARVFAHAGWLADRRRDSRRVDEHFARSVELAERCGERKLAASTLLDHADALVRARMPRSAVPLLDRALGIAEELGDVGFETQVRELRASARLDLADLAGAVADLERLLANATGNDAARLASRLADAHGALGSTAAAIEAHQRSVAAWRATGERRDEVHAELRLGQMAIERELWGEAALAFERALGLAESDDALAARALAGKAAVLERRGDGQLALVFHGRRLALVRKLDDAIGIALTMLDIGRCQRMSRRLDEARFTLEDALPVARSARKRLIEADLLRELAATARDAGALEAATRRAVESARQYLEAGRSRSATHVLEELAAALDDPDGDTMSELVADLVEQFVRGPHTGRAQRLLEGGRLLMHFGAFKLARKRLDAALAETGGDPRLHGAVLQALGQASRLAGDSVKAVEHFGARVALERERGHPRELAYALNSLAAARVDVGAIDESLSEFEECRALMERIGDRSGLAVVLNGIATPLHLAGRADEALAALARGLEIQQGAERRGDVSVILNTRGEILRELGRTEEAIEDLERCLELAEAARDERGLAFVLPRLGRAKLARGDVDDALRDLERGVDVARRTPDRRQSVHALHAFGEGLIAAGRVEHAAAPLERGLRLAERLTDDALATALRATLARASAG